MLDTVYNVVGAASGAVKGVAEVGKKEAKAATSSMSSHALSTLSHLKTAVGTHASNATTKLYSVAGALSGVLSGAKYAGLCVWWYITEDEIKLRLIQGSPVKYKLKDLESLVQNLNNTVGMTPQYQQQQQGIRGQYNGNGVAADASVSLGAPVTSSNDHLAAQNHEHDVHMQARSRRREDFGNSVDESLEKKAISKTKGHKKKKGQPATPQQEEYSPRVLA